MWILIKPHDTMSDLKKNIIFPAQQIRRNKPCSITYNIRLGSLKTYKEAQKDLSAFSV